jgi:outer membrane biosynthesis protein TonB
LSAQLDQLSEVYQDFEDGHTLDEVLESAGLTGPLNDTGADYPAPPPEEQAEEDYFGSNSALADPGTPPESAPPAPPAPPTPPQPQPQPPSPPIRRRPSSAHPEDDDYFGGSPLGE